MSFCRLAYGLGIQSNLPIAGLAGLPVPSRVDVRIWLGCVPPRLADQAAMGWQEYFVSPEFEEHGSPGMTVWRSAEADWFRIAYPDGTLIVVDAQGSEVWASWPDRATLEDTATYLLGPILGFVLRLRGIACLHASAVAISGQAVALMGSTGSGKSTMAAGFARAGHAVLTDDVLALLEHGPGFEALPAYPRVRLWVDSVRSLFGSEQALPLITPNWDKRFLDLGGGGFHFQSFPLPLAAIYFLDEFAADSTRPHLEEMTPHEVLMSLIANTCANYLLDRAMRAREFEILGRLLESVPVKRLVRGADFNRLPDLCDLIARDVQQTASCTTA